MKNQIQLAKTLNIVAAARPFLRFLFYTFLGCSLAVSSVVRAITPPLDGGSAQQNTAVDEDALFSLATGADNAAMGFDALYSNTSGSDNALPSWAWRKTGRLNTARYQHTATLLQNGMVLVAAGRDRNGIPLASAELYDPASRTWIRSGQTSSTKSRPMPSIVSWLSWS